MKAVLLLFTSGLALLSGCKPTLDDTTSILTSTRILSIASLPAEAPPEAAVKYTTLVAGPAGSVATANLRWDYCNARNPLSNLGPIDVLCTQYGNSALIPMGAGLGVSSPVPSNACSNFGPNAPPAADGGNAGQPVDPDSTGGYYQPVSLFLSSDDKVSDSIYFLRVACGFSGASEATQGVLTARYHANENPAVVAFKANGTELVPDGEGKPNSLARSSKLNLEVSWPSCPRSDVCGDGVCGADESAMSCPKDCTTPKGCAGAERYVNFDVTTQDVVDQREGMHVAWYATTGTFDFDRTGRDGTDDATTSDDGWIPPASISGPVHFWVVLRDDRGGVGWEQYTVVLR